MTLNQVIRRIRTTAVAHLQLKNFYYGNVVDFLNDRRTRYASCFLQDNGASFDIAARTRTVNFKMFLLDLVHVSEETALNEQDVQSDMLSIVEDILALLDDTSNHDWKLGTGVPVTLVRESMEDMVAGTVVDLAIITPFVKSICDVPYAQGQKHTITWDYFDQDPYLFLEEATFRFNKEITPSAGTYSLDFTEAANMNWLVVKEPAYEPEKLGWRNTQFNYGIIPDQVFRTPLIISGYRYYVSRNQVVLDSNNTSISFNV